MKKEERIEAARKRIEELRKLIAEWTKKMRYILDVSGRDLELIKASIVTLKGH